MDVVSSETGKNVLTRSRRPAGNPITFPQWEWGHYSALFSDPMKIPPL